MPTINIADLKAKLQNLQTIMIANIVTIDVKVIAAFKLNQIILLYLNFFDQTISFNCYVVYIKYVCWFCHR